MTPNQIRCLDLYEKELRLNLPRIDRSVELNMKALAVQVREMRDLFAFSNWPHDKIYAAAIVYLSFFGYDPEEELAIAKRLDQTATVGERA